MEKNIKPENPNAFPSEKTEYTDIGGRDIKSTIHFQGMTLRDYFAAKAMQGLLANPDWMKEHNREKYLMSSEIIAQVAFEVSDAMLKKRQNEV